MAGETKPKNFFPIYPKSYWFAIFLANRAGHIPVHTVRHAIYRRLFNVKIGKNSVIHCGCRFFRPEGVSVGNNSLIYDNAFLDGRKGLTIGDNVIIGSEALIYSLDHKIGCPQLGMKGGPVTIKDRVYIGQRVTILPGVTIGEGAAVMAGAVVTQDVKPWTVVGGTPAQYIEDRIVVDYRLDTKFKAYFQ